MNVIPRTHDKCEDSTTPNKKDGAMLHHSSPGRVWLASGIESPPPQTSRSRHIGKYALTSEVAPWVKNALTNYQPTSEVLKLVKPFAAELHDFVEKERKTSSGLHDIDAIELTYQSTLEIGAAILLAADATDEPVAVSSHGLGAGEDDHFTAWGKLLTGLDCDPPIIGLLPFYLLMCQSFTLEPNSRREDYVYSTLTGVDWVSAVPFFYCSF